MDASYSKEIYERFQERRGIRLVSLGIFILVSGIYLTWRATIINYEAPIFSWLFYFAEVLGMSAGLMTAFLTFSYNHRAPVKAPKNLTVDVFVLAYQEPVQLLERTLRAARDISYPHGTWLLDDGNRPEMKEMAERLGCFYLAREENIGAKAGNINNGIKHSSAEFFAVFDADHVPLPNALDALLGHFGNDNVAIVQTPQDYYNTDSFQFENGRKGRALWHDQSLFYNISMSCRDSYNAATCVGTGAVYRRSAIASIGGIPMETVTEDLHTSIKLHKSGFEIVYVNEPVAFGVGAADLREYYKTRLRWGHGNIHALRHENVLFCKGLTLKQRASYLFFGLVHLEGWQFLLIYLVPIVSLLTGWAPFEITLFNIAIITSYPIFLYLLQQELSCGYGRYWVNEIFGMVRFPVYILASFAVLRNRLQWRSSTKQISGEISLNLLMPQLSVMALSLFAIGVAVFRNANEPSYGPISQTIMDTFRWMLTSDAIVEGQTELVLGWSEPQVSGYSLDLLILAGAWSVINLIRGGLFLRKVYVTSRSRSDDNIFHIPLVIEVGEEGRRTVTKVVSISESSIFLQSPNSALVVGEDIAATIYVPKHALKAILKIDDFQPDRNGNVIRASVRYDDAQDAKLLEKTLYNCTWQRRLFFETGVFKTPLQFFKELLSRSHQNPDKQNWEPALFQPEGKNAKKELVYLAANSGVDGPKEILHFQDPSQARHGVLFQPNALKGVGEDAKLATSQHAPVFERKNLGIEPEFYYCGVNID